MEIPERRFTIAAGANSELARMWAARSQIPNAPALFGKLQGSAAAHWLPQAQSDVYELQQRVSGGRLFGSAPIDELYLIGIERDTDLWLRAHIGTRDGRKGSSPLATTYFLTNSDFFRRIYSNGLLTIKAGPLLDIARTSAPTSGLNAGQSSVASPSSGRWFFDTGAEVKLTVLGTSVIFTWGHDLRSGNNAFYGTAMPR